MSIDLEQVLLCMDRSISHDWPHQMHWTDYEAEPQGRGKRPILTARRICVCNRCGTERRELFVKDGEWLYKIPNGSRYIYPPWWKDRERLEQADIRSRLKAQQEES